MLQRFRWNLTTITGLFAFGIVLHPGLASAVLIRTNVDSTTSAPTEPEETLTYVFTNLRGTDLPVPSNTSTDLANGLTPVILVGTQHGASGPTTRMTDGVGAAGTDDPGNNFFFNENDGRFRISLPTISPILSINSYSWHHGDGSRAPQIFELYASDGTAGGFDVNNPFGPGYVLIASVNTKTASGGTNIAAQHGASIIADDGKFMGLYQHFIFDVHSPGAPTFYSEIDILEGEIPVPEPSTLALLGLGTIGLAIRSRRHRNTVEA